MNATDNRPMPLVSMVFLIGLVLMLVGISFPAVLRARAAARGFDCATNLKQIAIATHNYHDVYKSFPFAAGGTDGKGIAEQGNDYRLSGFVSLLPFLDQGPLYDKISGPYKVGDTTFPSYGPIPSYDPTIYPFWGHQVGIYVCPEEEVQGGTFAISSYTFCYGDRIDKVGERVDLKSADDRSAYLAIRGVFARAYTCKMRDITDGTSNTLMCGETAVGIGDGLTNANVARDITGIAASPAQVLALRDAADDTQYKPVVKIWDEGKGSNWADGTFRITGFNTVLPPNSPSATSTGDPDTAIMSASSHHLGGAHVAMCDGSVRFVFNTIDTGDLTKPVGPGESPYGVWGALGTRAGAELIPPAAPGSFGPPPTPAAPPSVPTPTAPSRTAPGANQPQSNSAAELFKRLERIEALQIEILKKLDKLEQERNR